MKNKGKSNIKKIIFNTWSKLYNKIKKFPIKYLYISIAILILLIILIVILVVSNSNDKDLSLESKYNIDFQYTEVKLINNFTYNSRNMYQPKDGYTFLLIKVYIKNNDVNTLYLSDDEFICSVDDVKQNNVTYYAYDYDRIPVTIEPGSIGEGYIAFEVKKNENKFDINFNNKIIHIKVK